MSTTRRDFFASLPAAAGLLTAACGREETPSSTPADVTLRIGNVLADIGKDHTISTIGYNGAVPGR